MDNFIVCSFSDPDNYTISVNGRRMYFEWSDRFGPTLLNKDGSVARRQPSYRHLWWKATSLWAQQGKKVENGLCVWFHEPEPILQHMGGRNYLVVGEKPAVKGG